MYFEKPSLLDTACAAKYLGLTSSALEAWRLQGKGPEYLKLGRLVRYSPEKLDIFLASCCRQSTSASEPCAVPTAIQLPTPKSAPRIEQATFLETAKIVTCGKGGMAARGFA